MHTYLEMGLNRILISGVKEAGAYTEAPASVFKSSISCPS